MTTRLLLFALAVCLCSGCGGEEAAPADAAPAADAWDVPAALTGRCDIPEWPCAVDRQCVCADGHAVGWRFCEDGRFADEYWCPDPPPPAALPGCVDQPGSRVGWQQCQETGEPAATCWCNP